MNALDFEGLEEALHRRIVPTISRPTHRLNHAAVPDQFSMAVAGVLAATI